MVRIARILTVFVLSLGAISFLKSQEYYSVPGDPMNARIYTLKNGLKVYITVNKDEPRIQTYIAVRAGSKNDPPDATGLAHYFEHMMFKGTQKIGTIDFQSEGPLIAQIDSLFEIHRFTKDENEKKRIYSMIDSISQIAAKYAIPNEYDKLLSLIGASGTNAFTSLEQTIYVNEIPSNQFENWVKIEADRFRNPVLRIFHTELETIYEEKNMTLTKDEFKVFFAVLEGLFKKHTYGTQTLIGSTEHLKNPSMKRIREFHARYYIPNNIAICLSGDIDPDYAIKVIEKYFGDWESKPLQPYTFEKEDPITEPIIKEIYGPDAENLTIVYRLDDMDQRKRDILNIINMILNNEYAGLIDQNLIQTQKVLKANTDPMFLNDYCLLGLDAKSKQGQKLEEVKDLLLEQINNIKTGNFPDWLIPAIVTNFKLEKMKELEKNKSRAMAFVNSFISGTDWKDYVEEIDRLKKITKADVIDFANKYLNNNYIVVYKRTGKSPDVEKIKKPKITKIKINRDINSEFFKEIEENKPKEIEPVFVDFEKDIQSFNVKSNVPVYYVHNKQNEIFKIFFVFDIGSATNKKLPLALKYLEFLGTSKFNKKQIKEEFFKLGCTYKTLPSYDKCYIQLEGLSENFYQALTLLEELLNDAQPDPEALKNLIEDELKTRENNKKNQQYVFSYLVMYGIFGKNNPLRNQLSEKELRQLKPEDLITTIKELKSYEHRILYYGSHKSDELNQLLNKVYKNIDKLNPIPPKVEFIEQPTDKNNIYFVDYDQKQTQLLMLSRGEVYNPEKEPVINLFNEYFGSGMNSLVFQELREARALAYAAMSFYQNLLQKKNKHYYSISFIMTQNDKLQDALTAFFELFDNMPESDKTFQLAKNSIIQNIRTDRIIKDELLLYYEQAKELGLTYDIRKDIYEKVPNMTFADIKDFQQKNIKGKKYTFLVIGDKKSVDFKTLKKYGKIKKLSREEIFGY